MNLTKDDRESLIGICLETFQNMNGEILFVRKLAGGDRTSDSHRRLRKRQFSLSRGNDQVKPNLAEGVGDNIELNHRATAKRSA